MITTISLSTILITILIIMINMRAPEEDKFDIIEYIFAIIFGWIAVVYILITYNKYIFNFKEIK
jgi:hypothetical protein